MKAKPDLYAWIVYSFAILLIVGFCAYDCRGHIRCNAKGGEWVRSTWGLSTCVKSMEAP